MSEVYEMYSTDNNDVNVLTVDFTFNSEVDKDSAIALVDKLFMLGGGKTMTDIIDHKPTFFVKSRWSKEEEDNA
tara:strand:+ start:273 stop:494 length:222 start_codon:yes stop_codon:yes gene_type:complete